MGVLKAILVFLWAFILGRAATAFENLALRQQLAPVVLSEAARKPWASWKAHRAPAASQTSFLRTAQTAACVRSQTPILRRMCWTCSLIVS